MTHICILCNGTIRNNAFHTDIIKRCDILICADGGANHAKEMGIIPNYVVGDMDSITHKNLKEFSENKKTRVKVDTDEDKTDTEIAISLAEKLNATEITMIGAIGERMDHTLANIYSLIHINKSISAKIVDDKNEIMVVRDKAEIHGKPDSVVSILPLEHVTGLTYEGLRWKVTGKEVDLGWLGICNELTNKKAVIGLDKGRILLMRNKD